VLTEVAFSTCRGRELHMAAPEYMNDLRKMWNRNKYNMIAIRF